MFHEKVDDDSDGIINITLAKALTVGLAMMAFLSVSLLIFVIEYMGIIDMTNFLSRFLRLTLMVAVAVWTYNEFLPMIEKKVEEINKHALQ